MSDLCAYWMVTCWRLERVYVIVWRGIGFLMFFKLPSLWKCWWRTMILFSAYDHYEREMIILVRVCSSVLDNRCRSQSKRWMGAVSICVTDILWNFFLIWVHYFWIAFLRFSWLVLYCFSVNWVYWFVLFIVYFIAVFVVQFPQFPEEWLAARILQKSVKSSL